MSDRTFYRNTTTIVWLSEELPSLAYNGSIEGLGYALSEGPCVMHTHNESTAEVPPAEMARLLNEAGSDPSFFMLDDEGER
jgi:hypothetical protein